MIRPSIAETQEALRPIKSLLSKSEKACQKLTPGTWQHTMLKKNIKALQIASLLLNEGGAVALNDLQVALSTLTELATRVEKALLKSEPGTSQHTLQRNRLNALQTAKTLVRQGIERGNV